MIINNSVLRQVGAGIDTLYIGYNVLVKEKVLSSLEEKKEEAKVKGGGVQVYLGYTPFTLRPVGVQRYAYVLESEDLTLRISSKNDVPYPNVYVCLKSLLLLELGAENAVDKVRALISRNLGQIYVEKVSRVDMYADIAGVSLKFEDMEKFVTYADRRDIHVVKGKEVSGFSFGNGSLMARIYDKVIEIKKHKKEWIKESWSGVSEGEPVWRVEFQLRRKFLQGCSIEGFSSFQGKSGDIWRYLTSDWLSQRELDNANTTRRSDTSFWSKVKGVSSFFSFGTGEIVRETKRKGTIEHLIKMIKGCLTSIGAFFYHQDPYVTLSWVLEWVIERVKEELASISLEVPKNTVLVLEERSSLGFAREIERKAVLYA